MRLSICLLLLGSFPLYASVQDICSLDQPKVQTITNLAELEDRICDFRDSSNDREIRSTVDQTIRIISRLPSNPGTDPFDQPEDPMNNQQLVSSLRRVASLVTGRRSPAQFSSQRSDNLGESLNRLFTSFGTEQQRRRNQQGYYQAMRSVLAQTSEGARVLQCFERLDEGTTRTVVEFADAGEAAPTATYEARLDEASGSYHKVITIGAGDSPALTLSLLAHEMQHACNTPEFIRVDREQRALNQRFMALAETPGTPQADIDAAGMELEAKMAALNVRFALDELRAYKMTPAIFSELAPYHPEFFCNQFYVSSLFGRQIIGTGEYMSTVETSVADGSFFYNLIDTYVRSSGYNPAVFYVMDESTGDIQRDSQGRPVFRPEVREAVTREGFRVP